MKKIFPIAMIAVTGVLLFSSCKKNGGGASGNNSNYCRCGYKAANGSDSAYSIRASYGAQFSDQAAAVQCAKFQGTLASKNPGIQCSLE